MAAFFMLEDALKAIFAAPTLIPVTIGVIVAVRSLATTRHLTQAKHTLDFDTRFKTDNAKELIAAFKVVETRSDDQLRALGASRRNEDADFKTLIKALNVWEHVGIGLKNQVYSRPLLMEAYGTTVIALWVYSVPFIRERQKHNDRVYRNFDWLVMDWLQEIPMPGDAEAKRRSRKDAERRALDDQRKAIRAEVEEELRKKHGLPQPGSGAQQSPGEMSVSGPA